MSSRQKSQEQKQGEPYYLGWSNLMMGYTTNQAMHFHLCFWFCGWSRIIASHKFDHFCSFDSGVSTIQTKKWMVLFLNCHFISFKIWTSNYPNYYLHSFSFVLRSISNCESAPGVFLVGDPWYHRCSRAAGNGFAGGDVAEVE